MSVLEFDRVTYTYPGASTPALVDVSFAVEPGEFVVVAGMSASGKSSLVRAACGLVPHFHGGEFAGTVCTGGLDTRTHGPDALSRIAGTLFQDPETQIVMGTVRGELAFGLENRGHSAAAIARGVEETALALGIEGLLDRATDELSGGERQRVALGAALAGRPQIVLLDEPTSQLDPVAGDELVWFLRRLNEEWGTAVLLIEHRLERCLAAADRVFAIDGGRLVCDAPPGEFLRWAGAAAPALQTPVARMFSLAGLTTGVTEADDAITAAQDPPTGVKQARERLAAVDLDVLGRISPHIQGKSGPRRKSKGTALSMRGVWHEFPGGGVALRAADLDVDRGELVALMGRNGAGKSTLMRNAAGLDTPTRGKVRTAGRVALLLQNPGDYLLHESVGEEASAQALAQVHLDGLEERHPHDLSGGQRQRLALATVLDTDEELAVICLDEPTRGMDRATKHALAERLVGYAGDGVAVVVATHDAEFAADFAQRVVLLADGRAIADAPIAEVLTGGWYFATEVARVLGGAGGALTPEEGARLIKAQIEVEV
ncbi:MAG TPA: ATP-binding cassette domain-containing protein [Baekduia sp.]|nr:ATP-binding cassette domain-containing protein [Baekduia sp.]